MRIYLGAAPDASPACMRAGSPGEVKMPKIRKEKETWNGEGNRRMLIYSLPAKR